MKVVDIKKAVDCWKKHPVEKNTLFPSLSSLLSSPSFSLTSNTKVSIVPYVS